MQQLGEEQHFHRRIERHDGEADETGQRRRQDGIHPDIGSDIEHDVAGADDARG